jgi:hypothetical protein
MVWQLDYLTWNTLVQLNKKERKKITREMAIHVVYHCFGQGTCFLCGALSFSLKNKIIQFISTIE